MAVRLHDPHTCADMDELVGHLRQEHGATEADLDRVAPDYSDLHKHWF